MVGFLGDGFALHHHVNIPTAGFGDSVFISGPYLLAVGSVTPAGAGSGIKYHVAALKIRLLFMHVAEIGHHYCSRAAPIVVAVARPVEGGVDIAAVVLKGNEFAQHTVVVAKAIRKTGRS